MAEYKVTRVSEQPPKEYHNEKYNSTTYYIKVQVEGWEKPIEVGKKSPDAIKVGDILYGTIESTRRATDKFKSEPKPFGGGFNNGPKPQRDDSHIRAQWAIGQAMTHFAHKEEVGLDKVEKLAGALFLMVDRVKTTAPEKSEKGKYDADMEFVKELGEEINPVEDRPLDVAEIPF